MYLIYEKDNLGRTILELVFKNTGSIYAKDGVAYMLAHILNTKGTLDKKERFISLLEERAIHFHVTTNKEYTTLHLSFLNEKKPFALKSLSDILKNPNLTQKSLDKAIIEVNAKKESLKNNNDYIASTNLFRAMFEGELAIPVIGEDIEDITLFELAEHFKFFSASNLVILNGGKKCEIDFIEILPKKIKEDKFFTPKTGEIIENKETEQAYIYFGAPFNVEKNEFYLAKIATFIFGAGGFGSRMMEEIRVKRGYAYSAYATNEFKRSYKIFRGYLQTKLQNQEDAKKLVVDMIDEFVEKGITQEELDTAKKFLIGSEPLRNETLSQRLNRKFNEYYLNLGEGYFEKELNLIQNATLEEVNSFIKKHKEIKNLSFSIVTK